MEALIIVDMQRDFMPGGALPVPEGDKVIPAIEELIKKFKKKGGLIIATRDWHPPDHISFKEQGGPWPRHCVQNTEGAEIVVSLPEDAIIISKADRPDKEAYSGFEGTGLAEILKERESREFTSVGLPRNTASGQQLWMPWSMALKFTSLEMPSKE